MIIIEFCCGSKSFTKEAELRGHECFTLDFDKKFNPNLCMDILNFEIDMLPEKFRSPDGIWFSPPCTKYSHANRKGKPDLTISNKVVQKCLSLIKQFQEINPKIVWVIENPQTGTLKKQEFMLNIPFTDASYCKYGLPYRKQTRFWNNIELKLNTCNKDCQFMDGKKHIMSVGNGRSKYTKELKYSWDKKLKYKVPIILCQDIIKQMEVKSGCNANDNGIPPNNKLLGILPTIL